MIFTQRIFILLLGFVLIAVTSCTSSATEPPVNTIGTISMQMAIEMMTLTAGANTPTPLPCDAFEYPSYVTDLQKLINTTRTRYGLNKLTWNDQLAKAAKMHGLNMLCNGYLSHIGLDGSTPQMRVSEEGYKSSLVLESFYVEESQRVANPQNAFNFWMNDPTSLADILNGEITDFGISYLFSDTSILGAYFVVVFATP